MLRRGAVVKTLRDRRYDPENMKRFVAGEELPADLLVVEPPELDFWPAMWKKMSKNIDATCYAQGDRELLWYKTGEGSWTSSVYPRTDAGPATLRPIRPVTAPSSGIVARFDGEGALHPRDSQVLTQDQMTTVGIAAGLMNRCLSSASSVVLTELRVSLPRENDNQTPIYFYKVEKGTALQKSPNALIVVLPEGYYNSYVSTFNRMLWVIERPFASDAAKISAIQAAIKQYIEDQYPKDLSHPADAVTIAWSQILQSGTVDELISPSLLPGEVKTASSGLTRDNSRSAVTDAVPGEWLRADGTSDGVKEQEIDPSQAKTAGIAVALTNLYLGRATGVDADQWRRWYPKETRISFQLASGDVRGSAAEQIRDTTSAQGEKSTEVSVTVVLPARAYVDYPSALEWMLGVLEVNARGRDRSAAVGGQGTGVASVLAYLRQLDVEKDPSLAQTLAPLGINPKRFAESIPDVPTMFLNATQDSSANTAARKSLLDPSSIAETSSRARPRISAQYPSDIGQGPFDAGERRAMSEVVRVLNLYLDKPEAKPDKAAEELRQGLPAVTDFYVYRNSVEAVHLKPDTDSEVFLGYSTKDSSYTKLFLELIRVLEMRNERLTKSPEKRQDIAASIRSFLQSYARQNPGDGAAAELSEIDVKTMTNLW